MQDCLPLQVLLATMDLNLKLTDLSQMVSDENGSDKEDDSDKKDDSGEEDDSDEEDESDEENPEIYKTCDCFNGKQEKKEKLPYHMKCVCCGGEAGSDIRKFDTGEKYCVKCFTHNFPKAPYCSECGITDYFNLNAEMWYFNCDKGGSTICIICSGYYDWIHSQF